MLQNQAEHATQPQRLRYADCSASILITVDNYPNRQIMDYLPDIPHKLSL